MKTVRTMLALVLALSLTLTLAGCGADAAATVNGVDIPVEDVEFELDAMKAEYPQMFQGVDGESREIDFRWRILENLVVNELVAQAAEDEGIEITESDLDDALAELKAGFPTEEQFQQSLDQIGMTVEDLRAQLRDQLLSQAILEVVLVDVEVSEDDIVAYYEANQATFSETAAKRAAHILFAIDDEEAAQRVLEEIEGGASFSQLAEQYSIDEATRAQGGDLGWPSTPYVAEFEAALAELDTDEVSGLVETVFGWHIITVLDSREARVRTLDETREEIELILVQQVQADEYQQFVDGLLEAAEIEYFVDYAPAS